VQLSLLFVGAEESVEVFVVFSAFFEEFSVLVAGALEPELLHDLLL
jgi:hypothetical protein